VAGAKTLDEQALVRALAHPLRLRMLEALLARPGQEGSAVRLAEEFERPIGTIAYHMRQLADKGLIHEVRATPVRGTLEHFYSPTPGAQRVVAAARELKDALAALSG
jgi:DNA-binding transcriptional ArsR family regulator